MEKLKSILKLKFIREIPRENKMAYLVSAGIGIGASILMVIFSYLGGFDFLFARNPKYYEFVKFLIFSNLFPIFVLILLLVLSKKISVVWKKIKIRMICVVILSVICMYSYDFIYLIASGDKFYKVLFLPIWMFFGIIVQFIEYPLKLLTFLCSNIFIVMTAAYLTTKGIANLPKRIILFLIIGFLISIAAGISFIIGGILT